VPVTICPMLLICSEHLAPNWRYEVCEGPVWTLPSPSDSTITMVPAQVCPTNKQDCFWRTARPGPAGTAI
jgi:hypothetical protein